jgi:membrane associated rhomboid family serine protease
MSRVIVLSPIIYSIIGAAVGESLAMLFLKDTKTPEWGQVPLKFSLPLAAVGAIFGWLVGFILRELYRKHPPAGDWPSVLIVTLLVGSMGAPLGWLVGDTMSRRLSEHGRLTHAGMAWGIAIGVCGGFVLGIVLTRRERRRSQAPVAEISSGR